MVPFVKYADSSAGFEVVTMHGREDRQCSTQVSRFLHVQLQLLGVDGPSDRGQPHDCTEVPLTEILTLMRTVCSERGGGP